MSVSLLDENTHSDGTEDDCTSGQRNAVHCFLLENCGLEIFIFFPKICKRSVDIGDIVFLGISFDA